MRGRCITHFGNHFNVAVQSTTKFMLATDIGPDQTVSLTIILSTTSIDTPEVHILFESCIPSEKLMDYRPHLPLLEMVNRITEPRDLKAFVEKRLEEYLAPGISITLIREDVPVGDIEYIRVLLRYGFEVHEARIEAHKVIEYLKVIPEKFIKK